VQNAGSLGSAHDDLRQAIKKIHQKPGHLTNAEDNHIDRIKDKIHDN
jgi:hypothetical protein